MSKRRTKKQKKLAQARRSSVQSIKYPSISTGANTNTRANNNTNTNKANIKQRPSDQLTRIELKEKWMIDDALLRKDLLKSFVVTIFLLILLFGTYLYLR